jgi:hypothetical protein
MMARGKTVPEEPQFLASRRATQKTSAPARVIMVNSEGHRGGLGAKVRNMSRRLVGLPPIKSAPGP